MMLLKKAGWLGVAVMVCGQSAWAALPFEGAFVETSSGLARSKGFDIQTWTTSTGVANAAGHDTFSTGSKWGPLLRIGVGYGYSVPNTQGLFLAGQASYSLNHKIDKLGSKLKNRLDFVFQPGYYVADERTLLHATVGYSTAKLDGAGVSGSVAAPEGAGTTQRSLPDSIGGGGRSVKGTILGVGAKYAVSELVYVGLDYTRTQYKGFAQEGSVSWSPGGNPTFTSQWQRDDKVKLDTYLLTVGYRFR